MATWKLEENIQRDMEKAQESIELYGGHVLKAPNKYEIRSGVVVAARFADKLRRTAFAVFGGIVPREEIVRATSELNKKIYEALISMGVGKLDIVRITVEAAVEGGRLIFGEPKIEWFVPHSEMQKRLEECEKRFAEIRKRIESLLKEIP
ncbi:single- stranded DNA-binding family protein [Pyrobaculum sp.]|uniref:single- stranded DNA-binding family protein n=1 Tax=Pyrobaculum sp. TaxID=2004705 RepID=UPI003D0DD57C